MSLLLDALKKAEKAKEEARRRQQEQGGDTGASAPGASTESARVRTRDELPNITQSLQISSDDLTPSPRAVEPNAARPQAGGESLALELEPRSPPASAAGAPPARPATGAGASTSAGPIDPQAAGRATAKKVFEAGFREPNPRLPFYITLGVLGVFALGTVGYFWYQLRPHYSLVNANPQRPPGEVAVTTPAPATAVPGAAGGSAAPATQAIAGLPGGPEPAGAPSEAPAAAPASPASQTATTAAVAPPAAEPAAPARTRAPAPRAAAAPEVRRFERPAPRLRSERRAPQVNPQVAAAYQAYQNGDLAAAGADYQRALQREPTNRDALLGLAAIAMRTRHYGLAEGYYQRLLEANPRDPNAQAGMLALRSALIDPVAAESRVKSLLASDPQADVLYFTLGNEYAQQRRWGDAQQAYVRALAADPDNPDIAYNAAVSFDHLGQHTRALEYYRRALALAGAHAASFDESAARARVAQLAR